MSVLLFALFLQTADLVLRDWRDVPGALANAGEGAYVMVKDRSRVLGPSARAFPHNTELEAALTFEARDRPGPIVRRLTPDGRSFTVRQHLTLAALPDGRYRPRELATSPDPALDAHRAIVARKL